MQKKFLVGIVFVCLFVFAVADFAGLLQVDFPFVKEKKDALQAIGLGDFDISEFRNCDENKCLVYLYKENVINTFIIVSRVREVYVYDENGDFKEVGFVPLSLKEMEVLRDELISERLEGIADAEVRRQFEKTVLGEKAVGVVK